MQTSALNTNWGSMASSADGATLYASGGTSNQAPIYISTDSGNTWTQTAQPITNSLYVLETSADGTCVFAATELPGTAPRGATNPNPFFISTNSGASWNSIGFPTTSVILSAAMSADGRVLVAGAVVPGTNLTLVYISTNSGGTWSTNQIAISSQSVAVAANGQRILALKSSSLLTTTNAGLTWTTNALPPSPYSWTSVDSSADGTKLFAVGYKSRTGAYVCISTNEGVSWGTNTVSSSFTDTAIGSMAVSADGTRLALPTSGPIFISTNAGAAWVPSVSPATNWNQIVMSADGSKLAITEGQNSTDLLGRNLVGTGGIWTTFTAPTPVLNFTPQATNLTLSWTVPSTILNLQQCSDLTGSNWMVVEGTPSLNPTNLQYQFTSPISSGNAFFRLAMP